MTTYLIAGYVLAGLIAAAYVCISETRYRAVPVYVIVLLGLVVVLLWPLGVARAEIGPRRPL
jgi:4-amino-4-deoxy-L-arabinose transferase-like glycosyltransferase